MSMFSKKEVLEIVDSCFHMYASSHRAAAKERAEAMVNKMVGSEPNDKHFLKLLRDFEIAADIHLNSGGGHPDDISDKEYYYKEVKKKITDYFNKRTVKE